jgi:Flp pilus assembly protein TadD
MTPKSQAPARNNRCPCGSGRKFKHCCLLKEKTLDSAVRFTQALAHEQRGEGVKAQALYVEILTADPDFSPALQALGIIQYRQGDRATGLKFLTRARELTPDDPEMLNTLGVMLTDEGQIPEAIVCLHRAVQLLPE